MTNNPGELNATPCLGAYYAENRVFPSYAQIVRLLGFRSKSVEEKQVVQRVHDLRAVPESEIV